MNEHVAPLLNRVHLPAEACDTRGGIGVLNGILALALVLTVRVWRVALVIDPVRAIWHMVEYRHRAREDQRHRMPFGIRSDLPRPLDTPSCQMRDRTRALGLKPRLTGCSIVGRCAIAIPADDGPPLRCGSPRNDRCKSFAKTDGLQRRRRHSTSSDAARVVIARLNDKH
jgi:hypothetical protein